MGYAKSEWFLVCLILNLLFFVDVTVALELDYKFAVERFLLCGVYGLQLSTWMWPQDTNKSASSLY